MLTARLPCGQAEGPKKNRLLRCLGPDELQVAKSYVVGCFALAFQRAARRAAYMILAERFRLPADYLESAPRTFAAVTADVVQRAARRHLNPDACCIAAA